MMGKSLRDIAREVNEEWVEKTERKALKKARDQRTVTLKVYKRDVGKFLDRGWEVISHTPASYVTVESYLMSIQASVLKDRS